MKSRAALFSDVQEFIFSSGRERLARPALFNNRASDAHSRRLISELITPWILLAFSSLLAAASSSTAVARFLVIENETYFEPVALPDPSLLASAPSAPTLLSGRGESERRERDRSRTRANFNFRRGSRRDNRSRSSGLDVCCSISRLSGGKKGRYCRCQPVGQRNELYRTAGIFIGKRARRQREKTSLGDVDIAARIHGFRFRRVTTHLTLSFPRPPASLHTCFNPAFVTTSLLKSLFRSLFNEDRWCS